jgi:serine/threonine protein kinase
MLGELRAVDPRSVGPYRLLGRLGSGGMGQVYLGRSLAGGLVAVKVIRPDLAGEPGFRMRFAREFTAARNVSGMFTVQVVDADVSGPVPWLATVYVPGPSLSEAVASQGPLPTAAVLTLASGLAQGLHAIHSAGVVHRDLKPANVLLARDGPRVIDFGISRAAEVTDTTALTQTGLVLGSPGFMSPEQAEGAAVGPPSDVFSLGAVLTFAATGAGPFGTGSTPQLLYRVVHNPPDITRLPREIKPLVERCLVKDPSLRPGTGDLVAALGTDRPAADWLPAPLTAAVRQYLRPGAPGHIFDPTQPWALEELFAVPEPGDAVERRRRSNRRHLTLVSAAAAAVLAAGSASAALTLSSAGAPHRDATNTSPRSNVAASPSAGRTQAASPRVSPTPKPTSVAQAQQAATRKSSTTSPASSGPTPTSPAPRTPTPTTPTPTPSTPTPTPTPTTPTPTPTTSTPPPSTPPPSTPPPSAPPPTTPPPSTAAATHSASTAASSTPAATRSASTAASSTPTATRSASAAASSTPTATRSASAAASGTPTATPSANRTAATSGKAAATPSATRTAATPGKAAASSTPRGRRRQQWAGDRRGRGRAGSRRRGL